MVCVFVGTWMPLYFPLQHNWEVTHTGMHCKYVRVWGGITLLHFWERWLNRHLLRLWLCTDGKTKPERLKALSKMKPRSRSSFLHWKFGENHIKYMLFACPCMLDVCRSFTPIFGHGIVYATSTTYWWSLKPYTYYVEVLKMYVLFNRESGWI